MLSSGCLIAQIPHRLLKFAEHLLEALKDLLQELHLLKDLRLRLSKDLPLALHLVALLLQRRVLGFERSETLHDCVGDVQRQGCGAEVYAEEEGDGEGEEAVLGCGIAGGGEEARGEGVEM